MGYGLKQSFLSRSKKVFSLTPSERADIKKLKAIPKKQLTKVDEASKSIDFGRLVGRPLRKPVIKRIKKRKTPKFVMIKGKKFRRVKAFFCYLNHLRLFIIC